MENNIKILVQAAATTPAALLQLDCTGHYIASYIVLLLLLLLLQVRLNVSTYL